ncbi:MAG TPA: hypothetical protein VJU78_11485 [Chitinophagaceae bacterium]|nr:hypothetical protein [Chitinophagaceae bacterium]
MSYQVPTPASTTNSRSYRLYLILSLLLVLVFAIAFGGYKIVFSSSSASAAEVTTTVSENKPVEEKKAAAPVLASPEEYDRKIQHITNGDSSGKWPVKTGYPLEGAILPFKRIVSFYGNLYSKQMGILGELPRAQMLAKLKEEVAAWQQADSVLEVIPALHYIAVTAQQAPGKGNKYRLRMPFHQIDSVLSMAKEINAIVFIDVQVGLSTLQQEIPELEKYLKMPNVHLGIDPEFSMKTGHAPGKVVGSFDAADINYTMDYMTKLVKENNLPPKILIVHRFTQNGVTNYKQIKTRPEVQFVMDMDGWGHPPLKIGTYKHFIHKEPVEYTGFKVFYKNDMKNNGRLLTPKEILALKPQPVYIQYQ